MRVKNQQSGFTIIELLIATTVFSIVLLGASMAIVQIGRVYYKGLISAKTQEVSRSIVQSVSEDLQYSDSKAFKTSPAGEPAPNAICIGTNRYTYWLGIPLEGANHGLVTDSISAGSDCVAGTGAGTELLGQNMRLIQFSVTPASGGIYKVTVGLAYGDSDLLTTYNQTTGVLEGNLPDTLCRSGIAGSNFCATSTLDTTVKRRLE